MLEKIKQNKFAIYLVLAIVAGALYVPSAVGLLSNEITDHSIMYFAYYALMIAAAAVLASFAGAKKKIFVLVPLLLVEAANALTSIYSAIVSESYYSLVYVALYVAIVVFYFIGKTNKKLFYVTIILLLVEIGFALAGVLGGSAIVLGHFIIIALITLGLYLENKEKENEEV